MRKGAMRLLFIVANAGRNLFSINGNIHHNFHTQIKRFRPVAWIWLLKSTGRSVSSLFVRLLHEEARNLKAYEGDTITRWRRCHQRPWRVDLSQGWSDEPMAEQSTPCLALSLQIAMAAELQPSRRPAARCSLVRDSIVCSSGAQPRSLHSPGTGIQGPAPSHKACCLDGRNVRWWRRSLVREGRVPA